jgi:hypothetical protein
MHALCHRLGIFHFKENSLSVQECKTLNKRDNATTYEEVIYACSSIGVFHLRIPEKYK